MKRRGQLKDPTLPPPNGLIELVTPPQLAKQFKDVLGLGNASTYIGMGIHPAIGSLTYDPKTDEVIVNFPVGDPFASSPPSQMQIPVLCRSSYRLNEMLEILDQSNQATSILPLYCMPRMRPPIHWEEPPLEPSVISSGELGAIRGLYVVDGAFVPGFTGAVNPS